MAEPDLIPLFSADELPRVNAENERLRTALDRISSVQLNEPGLTDPDWKARLMQAIAREAITT